MALSGMHCSIREIATPVCAPVRNDRMDGIYERRRICLS